MGQVASAEHRAAAARWRALMARHQELELLIQIGEYREGGDALADEAVRLRAQMQRFLAQSPGEHAPFVQTVAELDRLVPVREDAP